MTTVFKYSQHFFHESEGLDLLTATVLKSTYFPNLKSVKRMSCLNDSSFRLLA